MDAERNRILENFFKSATLNKLKAKLRKLNLSTSGNKAPLMMRLQEACSRMDIGSLEEFLNENEEQYRDDEEQIDQHVIIDPAQDNRTDNVSTNNSENLENLDREIREMQELLKKKQELIELKRKLSTLVDNEITVGVQGQIFNFKDIENSLPVFTGDDNISINTWLKNFEENADMFGWDDRARFVFSRRLMGGTAKLFLRTVSASTWLELKSCLIREFKTNVSKAEIHHKLRMRKKRRDETYHQYVLNMLEIASLSDIDEQDILQYIIAGIPDDESNKVILYQSNSIDKLKLSLRKYEMLKKNQAGTTHEHKKNFKPLNRHYYQQNFNNVKCYNCNHFDRVTSKYTKPRRDKGSCFNCGDKNHKINDSPSKIMNINDDVTTV